MDTQRMASEYRLAKWTQFMRERKESGLSIKAFCENAGVHANVYYYWHRKVREAVCEQIGQTEHLISSGFAEVKLIEQSEQPNARTATQLRIELEGIQNTTDSAYPADRLAALLLELVGTC